MKTGNNMMIKLYKKIKMALAMAAVAATFFGAPLAIEAAEAEKYAAPPETKGVKALGETKKGHEDAQNPEDPQNVDKEAKKNEEKSKPSNGASSAKQRDELGKKEREKKNLKNESYKRYSGEGR